jgi:transcriptional regulator with XRE-family HTH domain
VEIGRELRATRTGLGLSQATVARVARCSPSRLGRIERGDLRVLPLDVACRVARALGLALSLKLYPSGSPIRDAGQLALLGRVESIVAMPLNIRREVVLPAQGELRAWDAAISDDRAVAFLDAEARIGDIQALNRRMELKLRDDPRGSILILVAARTRHNLEVLRDHRETLRPLLPLDGAAIIRALRAGRLPPASGILVI